MYVENTPNPVYVESTLSQNDAGRVDVGPTIEVFYFSCIVQGFSCCRMHAHRHTLPLCLHSTQKLKASSLSAVSKCVCVCVCVFILSVSMQGRRIRVAPSPGTSVGSVTHCSKHSDIIIVSFMRDPAILQLQGHNCMFNTSYSVFELLISHKCVYHRGALVLNLQNRNRGSLS